MTPDKVEAALVTCIWPDCGHDSNQVQGDTGCNGKFCPKANNSQSVLAEMREVGRHQEVFGDIIHEWASVLTEALAESRRDAARYRFVRDGKSRGMVDLCITEVTWGDPAEHEILTDTEADAAIDAAMKESP